MPRRCSRSTAMRATTAAGATTRSTVSPQGRGASSATSPSAQRTTSSTAASRAGPVDHPLIASPSAAPAVTGSSAHTTHARTTTRSPRAPLRSTCEPAFVYYELHARHRASCPGWRPRSAACRIATPPRRPRSCCAACPSCRPRRSCRPARRSKASSRSGRARSTVCTSSPTARSTVRRELDAHGRRSTRRSTPIAHGGLLTFLDAAAASPAPTAPREGAGAPARSRSASRWSRPASTSTPRSRSARRAPRAWARALEELVAARLPDAALVLFFDEPALVRWHDGDGAARPRARDRPPLGRARGAPAASPRCMCAATATCASRSTPAPASCTSTSARSISTTPSRSPGSSRAAAG